MLGNTGVGKICSCPHNHVQPSGKESLGLDPCNKLSLSKFWLIREKALFSLKFASLYSIFSCCYCGFKFNALFFSQFTFLNISRQKTSKNKWLICLTGCILNNSIIKLQYFCKKYQDSTCSVPLPRTVYDCHKSHSCNFNKYMLIPNLIYHLLIKMHAWEYPGSLLD